MHGIADTPKPPYYAVVFTSRASGDDAEGYERMAQRMVELAPEQPGFLGIETVRGEDGTGITVSYWQDRNAIKQWREQSEHRVAQELGKNKWYAAYQLRICKVETAYGTSKD